MAIKKEWCIKSDVQTTIHEAVYGTAYCKLDEPFVMYPKITYALWFNHETMHVTIEAKTYFGLALHYYYKFRDYVRGNKCQN